MKFKILLILIVISNIFYSQSNDIIFDSKCWKNMKEQYKESPVVFFIQNTYDNKRNLHEGKKSIVIYYQDSLSNWWIKLILVDIKLKKWKESESFKVMLFFNKYINSNLSNIKTSFKEMYEDHEREWCSDFGNMKFYYRDSDIEIINRYYSCTVDGINSLYDIYPNIFNLYSYAINSSFNMKFLWKYTKTLK